MQEDQLDGLRLIEDLGDRVELPFHLWTSATLHLNARDDADLMCIAWPCRVNPDAGRSS
jgi:hypothetical protein